MKLIKSGLLVLMLMGSQAVLAFDGNREGFILGLGGGFHNTSSDFSFNGSNYYSESNSGLATSFKMGFGISDQWTLFYVRNSSYYEALYDDGFETYDTTYVIGISGFGAAYYLSPSAPSGYFLGALGVGDYSAPLENDTDTGGAIMIGAGYEVSKHLHLEGTILNTNIDNSSDTRYNVKSSSIQFTVNYVWY